MTTDRDDTFDVHSEIIETPSSQFVGSTALIDLRRKPRYDTHLPAEAIAVSGEKVLGIITNISQSGLRLEGIRQMVNTLIPDFNYWDKHLPVTFGVNFTIPMSSCHSKEVRIKCRTVYTKQTTEDIYQIGVQFVTFDEGSGAFDDYLVDRATQG